MSCFRSMKMKATAYTLCITGAAIFSGCVYTGGSAIDTHSKGMGAITQDDYFAAKKPIDRHFIGSAWSKQFGPVDDPTQSDIRVKKERSFNGIQQDFAYNLGLALGGTPAVVPAKGEAGIQGGSLEKAKMEGLEIITPVNFGDVPFELDIPYVTEALRLGNFRINDEKSNKAGVNVSAGSKLGSGTAVAETSSQARRGTEGDGLVVAYKLHMIEKPTYNAKDSGSVELPLDKAVDFPTAKVVVKARLHTIEPGGGKSLPRNVLWACSRADAQSRDVVAAWLVDVKSTDPKRKSLTLAFPAFPKIDDCQNYSNVIFSRIDPLTDKINRQKLSIAVIDADLTDNLRPKAFDARVSLTEESFKVKEVRPSDL